jgi:hypothetical protein
VRQAHILILPRDRSSLGPSGRRDTL